MFIEIKTEAATGTGPAGLDYWMDGVLRQCDYLRHDFAPVPVHDLRVMLRRCRSIADGFMAFDPHPAWKMMKSESRRLFQQLGALRDTQVMREWVQRIAPEQDDVSRKLSTYLEIREAEQKEDAAEAVLQFDQKKWGSWSKVLTGQTRRIPPESIAFQHLALERLFEARDLHRRALRDRTQAGYHRLRIALKKFRYTLENFLPSRHERWGQELRELQDLLGEMHDLYVLWRTAVAIHPGRDEKVRLRWHRIILEESANRLEKYRARMVGKSSLLITWLSEFPRPDQLEDAAFARLRVWISFRDPDINRSEHLANLSLQIYDGLESLHLIPSNTSGEGRRIMEYAALAHSVGNAGSAGKRQIAASRLIRKLSPPVGIRAEVLQQIALVVRFHSGSLPRPGQKALSRISEDRRTAIVLMSGILRLADSLSRLHGRRTYRLGFRRSGEILYINAPGYVETDVCAEKIASARHLLETACGLAILIRGSVS